MDYVTFLPPTAPYQNLEVDEGFTQVITISAADGTTGSVYDLTGCTANMTVMQSGNNFPTFSLSSSSGSIVLGGITGSITVTIPGTYTDGLGGSQYIFDLVVTDNLNVSKSVVKGFLTINPVA